MTHLIESIQPFIDRREIPGAVVFVANREAVLAIEAAGWADLEARTPMLPGTSFWVASQTKPITAVAVMMLVEEGRLTLDDAVEKHLPAFAGLKYVAKKSEEEVVLRKPSRPVTVRDLITHQSGMPFCTAVEAPTLDRLPLATSTLSYASTPLEFDPGTDLMYSNAGFNTAGRLIEVLSGQSYESFLDERLFKPLGMCDTTFWPDENQTRHLASAYKVDADENRLRKVEIDQLQYPLKDRVHRHPMPAGGLISTAHDLAIFYRMMLNDGTLDGRVYLKAESVQEMTRCHVRAENGRTQGLGFEADDNGFYHGGAFGSHTTADRRTGLITGWLVQMDGTLGQSASACPAFREAAGAAFAQR